MKKFEHDSACCTFVGHFFDHDVYYCRSGAWADVTRGTLLARWGSEPSHYYSMSVKQLQDMVADSSHLIRDGQHSTPFRNWLFDNSQRNKACRAYAAGLIAHAHMIGKK